MILLNYVGFLTVQVIVQASHGQEIVDKESRSWKPAIAPKVDEIDVLDASQNLQLPLEDLIRAFPVSVDPLHRERPTVVHDHPVHGPEPAGADDVLFVERFELLDDLARRVRKVSVEGDQLRA